MNWLHLRDMGEKAEHIREFGTCFFEKYAQIVLSTVLGPAFEPLVNRDRPDLQSNDGHSIGIEVTRAMEESKTAEDALLKDISGITPAPKDDDLEKTIDYGKVCELLGKVMTDNVFKLIETAAQTAAEAILREYSLVKAVDIEVRKPDAPIEMDFRSVSVKIHRGWHRAVIALGSNMGCLH